MSLALEMGFHRAISTQWQAKFGHLSDGPEYSFLLILKYVALPRRQRAEDRDANVINGYPGTMQSCVRHEADSWLEWSLAGTTLRQEAWEVEK